MKINVSTDGKQAVLEVLAGEADDVLAGLCDLLALILQEMRRRHKNA